jgi:hypothetical protein
MSSSLGIVQRLVLGIETHEAQTGDSRDELDHVRRDRSPHCDLSRIE